MTRRQRSIHRANAVQLGEVNTEVAYLWAEICAWYPQVARHAKELSRGFPSSSIAGGGSSSGKTDPTGLIATEARFDPARQCDAALAHFDKTLDHIRRLWKEMKAVAPLSQSDLKALRTKESRENHLAAGAGSCAACEVFCSGAGEDRLKGGYCPTDHRAWLRYRNDCNDAGDIPSASAFKAARAAERERGAA